MNVAFVSNVVYPDVKGGAEKRIHEIGRRLAADGHEVTVYGRHYWDGPETMERDGMTLHAVAPSRDLYAGERRSITEAIDFGARALPTLRSRLPHHDVAVVSQFPYFPVLAAKLATVGQDVPLVVTWHEVWDDYWSEYLGRLAPGGEAVERLTALVPQRPVAVSHVTADRLARINRGWNPIDVVPNGIDTVAVDAVDAAADGHDVLYVGRLAEHKNVDTLLAAFDRAARDRDVTLGVVGDGPEAERLQRQAGTLDAADRIHFLGFVEDHDDVLAQMQAADVFASLSTREGFGITFVEAMAADCTVVAADHPASAAAEVVGDAGFLIDATVEDATAALDRALAGERPARDPTVAAAAYDWDAIADDALAVYRSAAE